MPGPGTVVKPRIQRIGIERLRCNVVGAVDASNFTIPAFAVGTIGAMLVARRAVVYFVAGKDREKRSISGDNRARALREAGDVLAIFLLGAGIIKNCVHGESLATDATWVAVFAALGIVLLELTGQLGLMLLFNRGLGAAIDKGNVAAGIAAACHYVAMGLITAEAVAGTDLHGVWLSVVFFALGLVVHQGVVGLFRFLTTYDDAEAIEGENAAAAISYGGVSLSVAIVIGRALEGEFNGWSAALAGFFALCAGTLLLYPVRQLVVQGLVLGARPTLRGGAIDLAVGRDRNMSVAALEAASFVALALAIAMLA